MAILTKSGRIVIAESIAARPIHLAWGTGDGAWTIPPSESADATALLHEVGRRVAAEVAFVLPDDAGEIVLPAGSFTRSVSPTNHLYIRSKFTFTEAPSTVIREIAVFVGTTVNSSLPSGQQYFVPADIVSQGRMLHTENLTPIYRSIATEETFEVILAF